MHMHTPAHTHTHTRARSPSRPRRYPTIAALTLSGTPSVPVDGQDHSALFDDPTDINGPTAAQYVPPHHHHRRRPHHCWCLYPLNSVYQRQKRRKEEEERERERVSFGGVCMYVLGG